LTPVALHQSGAFAEPGQDRPAKYNQAVPLDLIVVDIRRKVLQISDAMRRASRSRDAHIDETLDLVRSLGASEDLPTSVAREIVGQFGEGGEKPDAARLVHTLTQKATEFQVLKELLNQSTDADGEVIALRQAASSALESGDFAVVDAKLAEAETHDLELASEQPETASARRASAARSRGARGDVAMLRIAYREAADHYASAAHILGPDPTSSWRWLRKQGAALERLGEEFGDNNALGSAIELYTRCLEIVHRDQATLDWAETKMALGNALTILGGRESATTSVEQAVAVYREALAALTEPTMRQRWAGAQNNLGNALVTLGERAEPHATRRGGCSLSRRAHRPNAFKVASGVECDAA
jgi:tetratricopeptide (TPR) repeat protein